MKQDLTDMVLVHTDGGSCHGMAVVCGRCTGCGINPDMQSTEFWPEDEVRVTPGCYECGGELESGEDRVHRHCADAGAAWSDAHRGDDR